MPQSDTSEIFDALDLDMAKWLLGGNRAFNTTFREITPSAAAFLADNHAGFLDLSMVAQLERESAAELARHRGDIDLSGLRELNSEAAGKLSFHRGVLNLSGLIGIDVETALALAVHRGALHFASLKDADDHAFDALSKLQYPLWMVGLKHLSSSQAQALEKHSAFLSLDGLTDLSDELASSLGKRAGQLSLNSLTSIAPSYISYFIKSSYLGLCGLRHIPLDLAVELGKLSADLDLSGVENIDTETAAALAAHRGKLYLEGLTELSPDVARNLASHRGDLILDGVLCINDSVAAALSNHQGHLSLDGLKQIDARSAQHLSRYAGEISLLGLKQLCSDAANQLGIRLFTKEDALSFVEDPSAVDLGQFTHLTEDGIAMLRDWFATKMQVSWRKDPVRFLHFTGVRNISKAVALRIAEASHAFSMKGIRWFSKHDAYTSGRRRDRPCLSVALPAVTELTAGVPEALASLSGDLDLSGLKEIHDDWARMLCSDDGRLCWQPGILSLNGLKHISESVAYSLSQWKGWILNLDGVQSLHQDAASQLACFRGRVISLKGLESIGASSLPENFDGFIELPEMVNLPLVELQKLSACSCVSLNAGIFPSQVEYSAEYAKHLSKFRGILRLGFGMELPPPEAFKELANYSGPQLSLNFGHFFKITKNADLSAIFTNLASLQSQSLDISGGDMNIDVLPALKNFKAGLNLGSDISIDLNSGNILSEFNSKWIVLDNPQLTKDGCAAINDYRGWLILREINEISTRMAYLLSMLRGKVLSLPSLDPDLDIAKQLIKFNGYIDVYVVSSSRVRELINSHNIKYQKIGLEFQKFRPLFNTVCYFFPDAYLVHHTQWNSDESTC
ncbi:MAG: hypothetical protein ACK49N_04560 [Verrucomicrobiota bacterium]